MVQEQALADAQKQRPHMRDTTYKATTFLNPLCDDLAAYLIGPRQHCMVEGRVLVSFMTNRAFFLVPAPSLGVGKDFDSHQTE